MVALTFRNLVLGIKRPLEKGPERNIGLIFS